MIIADLTESFVDLDLDGDGVTERVFQARDCIVVNRRVDNHWDVVSITQRRVGRDIETVTLRPLRGARGIEVVDLRGTTRETQVFRWTGTELAPQQ